MRRSIIAGLALCAVLSVAGQAAADDKGTAQVKQNRYKQNRVAETRPQAPTQPSTYIRIPANPVIRDCVHIAFPQCSRGGLNDGTFGLPY
jgi:hypothetical protein